MMQAESSSSQLQCRLLGTKKSIGVSSAVDFGLPLNSIGIHLLKHWKTNYCLPQELK